VVASSESDPYRSKVAEEMLCEVIVQYRHMQKHYQKQSAYEGAVQQDCERLISVAAAADRPFRYSSV
jgi:hypothetical protein